MNKKATFLTPEQFLAVLSFLIALLVPTIGNVVTDRFFPITEKSFLWPWLIIVKLEPAEIYATDQYSFVTFPWSFILFIPFLYVIKLSMELFLNSKDRLQKSSGIALAALIQMGLIALVFNSQDPRVEEIRIVYYIPEILLIILNGIFSLIWFFKDIQTPAKNTPTSS